MYRPADRRMRRSVEGRMRPSKAGPHAARPTQSTFYKRLPRMQTE
jgi:hypothetical protein